MKFGVNLFPTDTSARPAEVAAEAEARGFGSFWVSEHSHMPLTTEFPLGGEVPREYASMLDPFVALASAAQATSRIELGTGILILPQHDPINSAKAVSSIDLLSGGRMTLGIGAGWNEPEMNNHGTAFKSRFKVMRERTEAMKQLWTHEEAEYHGDTVSFDPVWQWPKPVQQPHPQVLIAGAHPRVIERVARYGDGWMPVVVPEANPLSFGRMTPIAELQELVPQMNQLAADAGRAKPRLVIAGFLTPESYEIYESLGVDTVYTRVPSEDFDAVRRAMDEFTAAIEISGGQLAA